jgi:opacity protein-like surface antigen
MKTILVFSFVWVFSLTIAGQQDAKPKSKIFGITVSLPYINSYKYYDYDLTAGATKSGFGGIGLAFFYKNGKNKISLNYGLTVDLLAPIGPIDFGHEGTRIQVGARFIDLIYHRYLFNKVYVIGGLNMVRHKYNFISYVDTIPGYNTHDDSFGLLTGVEYAFRKNFSVAALYRPVLRSQDIKRYKHLLSLDFRFAINIWKK